jgi:hypothetical protein
MPSSFGCYDVFCILESRFTDKLDISIVIDGTIEDMLYAFVYSRVFEERILINRKTVQILVEIVKINRGRALARSPALSVDSTSLLGDSRPGGLGLPPFCPGSRFLCS